jgi:hypothetical protein
MHFRSYFRALVAAAFALVAASAFPQAPAPAGPAAAGKVDLVEGDVRFFDANRRMRRPGLGDVVYEGESIVTGGDGEVHLVMEDGGYIGVRPGTKMRIASYRAEGDDQDRSAIGLLEGTFRSVTGWIGRLGPDKVIVRTPTAVIGIRGTEHEPLYIPEGSPLGDPGTYDRVHVGETEIRTAQGAVAVRPNQAGFAPPRGVVRPRVLDRIPAAYRPTRNEARFQGLHARVQQQLTQRRDQRRQLIEQRRNQRPQPSTPGAAPRQEPRKSEAAAPGPAQRAEPRKVERDQKAEQREALRAQREAKAAEQRRLQQERREQAAAAKAKREAQKEEQQKRRREQHEKTRRE